MIAEHVAVVRRVDHDRVVDQPDFLQRLINLPHANIQKLEIPQVPGQAGPQPLFTQRLLALDARLNVLRVLRRIAHWSHLQFIHRILVRPLPGRMEGRVRLQESGHQEKGMVLELAQKSRGFASHERIHVVFRLQIRTDFVIQPHLAGSRASFAPQMGQLRKSAAVIEHGLEKLGAVLMRGDVVGVKLRLRAEVHEPVVEPEMIIEAMKMRLVEMHLADQAGDVAVVAEMVRDGAGPEIQAQLIVDAAVIMRIEAREKGRARADAHGVGAIRVGEAHALRGDAVEMRRGDQIAAGAGHQVRPMLIGHQDQNVRPPETADGRPGLLRRLQRRRRHGL